MRKYTMPAKSSGARRSRKIRAAGTRFDTGCNTPLGEQHELLYAGRAGAAAPATGIAALHEQQQKNSGDRGAASVPPEETSRQTMRLPTVRSNGHEFMTIEVRVPQLPESVADATLVCLAQTARRRRWRETRIWSTWRRTKWCSRCPAPMAGVLKEIKVSDGTTVTSGQDAGADRGRGGCGESGASAGPGAPAAAAAQRRGRLEGRRRAGAGRQAEPGRQAGGGGEQGGSARRWPGPGATAASRNRMW